MKTKIKILAIAASAFLISNGINAQTSGTINQKATDVKASTKIKSERLKNKANNQIDDAKDKTSRAAKNVKDNAQLNQENKRAQKELLMKEAQKRKDALKNGANKAASKERVEPLKKGKVDSHEGHDHDNHKHKEGLQHSVDKNAKNGKSDNPVSLKAHQNANKAKYAALQGADKSSRKAGEMSAKIRAAKAKLEQMKKDGSISETDYTMKMSKIKLAEQKLADLNATIAKERAVIQKNAQTLTPKDAPQM